MELWGLSVEGILHLVMPFLATFALFIQWLHPALTMTELMFASMAVSLVTSTWLAYLLHGFWYGALNNDGTVVVNCFFTIIFVLYMEPFWKKLRLEFVALFLPNPTTPPIALPKWLDRAKRDNPSFRQLWDTVIAPVLQVSKQLWSSGHVGFYFFSIAFFSIFAYLFNHHILSEEPDGSTFAGGAVWGDLPFHLNIITSFVYGPNQQWRPWYITNIIYSESPLHYTLLPDYQSAVLLKAGFSIRNSILIPSLMLSWAWVSLLYFFVFRFSEGSRAAGWLSVFLCIFSGGTGLYTWFSKDNMSWERIRWHDYTQFWELGEIYWFQLVVHVLFPQRAALYGYPIVLVIFSLIWTATVTHANALTQLQKRIMFIISGTLTGMLPLYQAHSWLGVNAVLGIFALTEVGKWANDFHYFTNWVRFGVPSVLLAWPQFLSFMKRASSWGFVQYNPVFKDPVYSGAGNPIMVWFYALGLFVPLSAIMVFALSRRQKQFYLGFWVLFVLCNVFLLQPWAKDNIKAINIWLFPAAGVISIGFIKLWRLKYSWLRLIIILLILSLTVSGLVSIFLRETNLHWRFQDPEQRAAGNYILHNTSPHAIFATSESHINPATCIAGRQQVAGYPGWLHSHGYDYGERLQHVKDIWRGHNGWENINRYNVTHLLRENSMENTPVNELWLGKCCEEKFRSQHSAYVVYEVRRDWRNREEQHHQYADPNLVGGNW